MTPIKLALIGCGGIGQQIFLPLLTRMSHVELIVIAEPTSEGQQVARHHIPHAHVYSSFHEVLTMREVEAVIICVPNALHAEVAIRAFEQGKHVYLEKPLATNLSEGHRIRSAWKHAGTVGMIGFNYRFNDLYRAMKQQLQIGKIGEVVGVRSVFSTATQTLPVWKQQRHTGGGVLLDLASHHIDLVHFFFEQPVQDVFASVQSHRSEGDSAVLHLRLANGLLVQSFFSLSAVEEDKFEVYGKAGKLTVDRYRSSSAEFGEPRFQGTRFKQWGRKFRSLPQSWYRVRKLLAAGNEPSYRTALEHFIRAIQEKGPASPDISDGYNNFKVIEAAEESAKTGEVVSLPKGI